MRITQRSDRYSIDPHVARPGSSEALFARTIDATQPPPLVKASEAVAAAIPRLIESVPPPLVGGTLGLTVLAVMLASHRVQLKLVPVLTAGVLLLPISNYHPVQKPAELHAQETVVAEKPRSAEQFDWRYSPIREVEPVEDAEEPEEVEYSPPQPNEYLIPPEITEGVVPLVEMVIPDDWTDEQQLRVLRRRAEKLMEEIRRLRLEQQLQERLEERREALSRRYHGL